MYTILQTESFAKWLAGLRDVKGKVRILAGGDKSTQKKDINRARKLADELEV